MIVKRCLLLAVCMILVLAILLPSCAQESTTTPTEKRPQDVELNLIGFIAGTSHQLKTDAIAEAIRVEYPDWQVTSAAAGSESRWVDKRIKGECDLFLNPYIRKLEVEAQTPSYPEIDFEQETAYSLVMPTSVEYIHFLVRGDTGLISINEVVDNKQPLKVGVGPTGSSLLFGKILEYYGTSWTEAESWGLQREIVVITVPEGGEAIQSGRINIGISWSDIPSLVYMGVTTDLKLLPFDDPGLVSMLKELGYYEATIPAGIYPFVTEDVPTLAQTQHLVVSPDMPEDVVYYILKALYNQKDLLIAAGFDIETLLTPESIVASIEGSESYGAPYHPGALKFYQELGWIE